MMVHQSEHSPTHQCAVRDPGDWCSAPRTAGPAQAATLPARANIALWWGVVMLVFCVLLFSLSQKAGQGR